MLSEALPCSLCLRVKDMYPFGPPVKFPNALPEAFSTVASV